MIFEELLSEKFNSLSPVFDGLLEYGLIKQTHEGDLLLVHENAHILEDDEEVFEREENKYYWQVGITLGGHSENTHYKFIAFYIRDYKVNSLKEYLHLFSDKENAKSDLDDLKSLEEMSIQIEMLIYLKIWEGDAFVKRLYQLINVLCGYDYDWHFLIVPNIQKKPNAYTRSAAIKKLITDSENVSIPLFNSMSKCYKTQLRNAIAHSQYLILGDHISLNNYNRKDKTSIPSISFDDWRDIFHETLAFYKLYLDLMDRINDYYFEKAKHVRYKAEIRINRKYPKEETLLRVLHSREPFKDWTPYNHR